MMANSILCTIALFFLLTFFFPFLYAQIPFLYAQIPANAKLNTTWVIEEDFDFFWGDYSVKPILLANISDGACYALVFYSVTDRNDDSTSNHLAIFIMQTNVDRFLIPQAVWYANRDHPVRENATLAFTLAGELSLQDADGTLVWSTNTSGKGVHTLSLDPTGNLVLADAQNGSVWESFDHPADVLVLGQTLKHGTRLIASTYYDNLTQGPYYMQMDPTGLTLYLDDPLTPQPYWSYPDYWSTDTYIDPSKISGDIPYARYRNGSLDVFISNLSNPYYPFSIPPTPPHSLSYLQLGVDGKIQVHSCNLTDGVCIILQDLQERDEKDCWLPTICGVYGICTQGECSCLQAASANESLPTDSFSPVVNGIPSLGCTSKYPLFCDASTAATHHFLRLDKYFYHNLKIPSLGRNGSVSINECEQRCLQNCSCRAAIFIINEDSETVGTCYPISRLYTITQDEAYSKSVVLIRMQSMVTVVNLGMIISVVLSSATIAGLLFLGLFFVYRRRRKRREATEEEEEYMLKEVQGLIPTRFSLKELKAATKNFSKILGAGGFGSVFLGALPDGSEVAVKRLESANQGLKEFHTEVRIIGSNNHVNLVRLRGFCSEKKHRLLVYEYMPKGSLEKWLFCRTNNWDTDMNNDHGHDAAAGNNSVLDWELRFNIGLGTARGLAYLHEGCSERIIHLDIKPSNILLDDHFVAKVSDFGLSKLMNRDQSRVVTKMRGTPGYLAPEWLHGNITEKADVYSFGILLFEIASGRKCVDMSVEESEMRHIPVWASRMVEEGRLMDVIDARLLQEFNREQAHAMVKVALWCIQENPTNRPSMGTVVQMLEGVVECLDPPLNVSQPLSTINQYTHTTFASIDSRNSDSAMGSEPLASILSGTR